jgi:hypothetical protein
MHYLGTVTEQLTHEDPRLAVARQQARQRREARRAQRQDSASPTWPGVLTREPEAKAAGRKHLRFLHWHGILTPHHH